ncbi:MAG: hypothetical protein KIB48_12575 [Enterobacter cloacae]|nr:hypothetical protein [Enterobacter cloacae]
MSHDAELIAKAISALQPKTDYLKDYVFPISMAFFSALLGGLSALHINRRQELKNVTKENFTAATQLYTLAHECLSNLIALKSNYQDINSDEPLIRANQFPTLLSKLDDISYNTRTLYFIRAIPTANKSLWQQFTWKLKHKILRIQIKVPSSAELRNSWRNTVRIHAMFSNYNQVMELMRFRNTLNEQVKHTMAQNCSEPNVPVEMVQKILGEKLTGEYVDVTESTIALTDYVIAEMYHFLREFPAIAESNLELSRIREMGRFLVYENTQEAFLECLKPIMKPDYKTLAKYTGATEEQLRRKNTYSDLV